MFGSTNPFGQSSTSPFGTQSAFGQASSGNSNPFAPNPFGSTTPFGTQTGGSLFGSTATGVFGSNQASSPLPSTPVFGASSSPAFGSTVPAFGAASTSGFGNTSSSSFGGSSIFGQKPSFGGFGSSTTQTSPFGSTFQQSQPAFGSNLFGSTPFGGSSQSAFSAPSTPAFGSSSTPAFGATNTPAFGATSSPAFGSVSTPAFGSTGNAFGVSSAPGFGSSSPAFGAASTPAFGATSAPAFGTSSSPSFGASTTPAFGASSPSFSFGSTPSFGQSTSAFGSTPFGASPSPFGAQSSAFGAQTTTPAFGSPGFGSSTFGGQRGGSRVAAYTPTAEADGATGSQPAGKLESISAMPVYKDKSHEELRWEDYQLGDKGGPNSAAQTAGAAGFGTNTQSNPFSSSSTFGQTAANPANPFSSTNATNPFGQKSAPFSTPGFAASTSAFGSSTFGNSTNANPFGSTSSPAPSLFGSTTSTFGGTPASPFGSAPATSAFGTTTSIFGSASAQGTTSTPFNSGLNFGNTQQSPLFQSNNTPTIGQSSSAFGQAPSFGQTTSGFGQTNIFNTPTTGFGGNMFSTTPSLLATSSQMGFGQTMPSQSTPFQLTQPSQNAGAFGNFGQTQSAGLSGFGGTSSIFGQSNYGQSSVAQNTSVVQQAPVLNPFGTLPAMPLMSIGRAGTSPSIQYGISSLPVVDKPAPARISSLLTSRHLSQRRVRLPARKYHPKNNGLKVPFFSDDEETPTTPKADTLFIPRENPRALVIRPLEQWPGRTNGEKRSLSKEHTPVQENGEDIVKNGPADEQSDHVKLGQKPNGVHDEHFAQKEDAYITLTGHRAGEAAIVYEHGADIEALMPKLRHSDYYTEPRIQELAAKERAEPGFCRRVKDFVVGRHGYGNIKFLGETDVRRLDLESLVQFNHREVIVYMDESKKPPVGQGLNKPAVVTLLNVKCFDKKTGRHFTEGPRIDKYKEMLRKKAEDQGAEFVSYDPIEGEWAFKVSHFSRYELRDEDLGLDDWE